MATTVDFIEFVTEQIDPRFTRRYRKMFGEYMVYVNEKPILLVCDNTVFVKIVPEIAEQTADAEKGFPYEGAKLHYVLDMENKERANEIISILEKSAVLNMSDSVKVIIDMEMGEQKHS
ncbi:MAG: transcriptional regulator [Clostridiales bacterium]|jgi:TfoX/Sxy family transcriptional regulator of competence genes|nr:transcriptional regulator [Clostridiales bacterium]